MQFLGHCVLDEKLLTALAFGTVQCHYLLGVQFGNTESYFSHDKAKKCHIFGEKDII